MIAFVVACCFVVGLLSFLCLRFVVVSEGECVCVERFGKFNRVMGPGVHVLFVAIDRVKKLRFCYEVEIERPSGGPGDGATFERAAKRVERSTEVVRMREIMFDPPPWLVSSKDGIVVTLNVVFYFVVADVRKAAYNVQDFYAATIEVVHTAVRDAIAARDLSTLAAMSSMDLEKEVLRDVDDKTTNWGVDISCIRIQSLSLPGAVREATERAVNAKCAGGVEAEAQALRLAALQREANEERDRTAKTNAARVTFYASLMDAAIAKGAAPSAAVAFASSVATFDAVRASGATSLSIFAPGSASLRERAVQHREVSEE